MGTHVVVARPMQPALCPPPPPKPQNGHFLGCLVLPANSSKFGFFQNPSVTPGMGLDDHLVTIRQYGYRSTHGNPCSGY